MLTRQREWFQPYKHWAGRTFGRLGLPPEFWTCLGLILALVAAWLYHAVGPVTAALCGTVASLTDFVDGAVARFQSRVTLWGNYLEAVVDRLVELTLLLTMAADLGLAIPFAIAGSMFISYCKPRVALVISTDNHDWPGVGDHSDRMVLILVAMALTGTFPGLAKMLVWCLVATTAFGSWQRVCYAKSLIERTERDGRIGPNPARKEDGLP